jgi:hypothetical protein
MYVGQCMQFSRCKVSVGHPHLQACSTVTTTDALPAEALCGSRAWGLQLSLEEVLRPGWASCLELGQRTREGRARKLADLWQAGAWKVEKPTRKVLVQVFAM